MPAELDKAFWIIEEVRKLPFFRRICLLVAGMILKYENVGLGYWVELELKRDWYISLNTDGVPVSEYTLCEAIRWVRNGVLPGPLWTGKSVKIWLS
jgi:hypothetical protein